MFSLERRQPTTHIRADVAFAAALPVQATLAGPLIRRGLSVVLPAYNEEANIEATVRRCVSLLSDLAPDRSGHQSAQVAGFPPK